MTRLAELKDCGTVSYEEGLYLQEQAGKEVAAGLASGCLLLLEHEPVITIGRTGRPEHVLASADELALEGIKVVPADRGGDLTCHNPGQIVGYPVLDLQKWQEDVHWYVGQLEEVIIRALKKTGIQAGRKEKYTGVWVGEKKIAAIGVSVRNWITGHGFAINVDNDMKIFSKIIPCGISAFGVTSMREQGARETSAQIKALIAAEFAAVFDCTFKGQAGVLIRKGCGGSGFGINNEG